MYQTLSIIRPPTPPISPLIRESTVVSRVQGSINLAPFTSLSKVFLTRFFSTTENTPTYHCNCILSSLFPACSVRLTKAPHPCYLLMYWGGICGLKKKGRKWVRIVMNKSNCLPTMTEYVNPFWYLNFTASILPSLEAAFHKVIKWKKIRYSSYPVQKCNSKYKFWNN
jgi:hypothetical protein